MNLPLAHSLPATVDVLIVGNGPVGASIAALLGRYGINTLVVDKTHDVLLMPRAIALDNEALRILQLAGLEEGAFEKIVIAQVRMHCPFVGQFGQANTRGSLDGHPKLVTFYQPDLERTVRDQYQRFENVTSFGGLELLNLIQDAEGVEAELLAEDGHIRRIKARYLVGADGASSKVRSLIGQDFQGRSYAEDWLIVDTRGRENVAIDHVEFLCDHRRPTPHMPAPGGRERWEFMLKGGETREQMEDAGRIARLLEKWIKPDQLEIERKAVYRFHARCCERFQKDRVFLIGDAAHITPPFVGQGLVAGLRDSANLAWKLAWVLKGRAGSGILDSYDQERRPHAKEMIALAKLMGRLVMPGNAPTAMLVHGLMRLTRLIPPLRRHLEELDIKPKNIFKRGLFMPAGRGRRLRRGGLFPQGLVRQMDGSITLSDAVLGDNLVLIGLGIDPRASLTPDICQQWEKHGGSYLQIGLHGQKSTSATHFVEDIGQVLLASAAPDSLAVVRPDRIVMHEGPQAMAQQLVQETLKLLES
ncbi:MULTISPECIES: bifunctional 3-(3-hydroxy-phenyl)propionate/3-hydroxycinnamic acid hydroxylase [unclassified Pseudomonas]|uniref:bifunctional 3-(3-hydroxy-phenyl)propionate/3-hydroxycinnamic acid hydroxylase n=1 Tax=unclassified Pseudomonas TaxID=196821 RepID=UPI0008763DCD|nr:MULTISPECIES: bifunctional 3-(3-hydroxy-phenyl)propionate/3-hydroxycinnamic acid hydroxylase [unclassified Pseudomonas]SCZ39933.1 3-(3-hydroxy-phenyl)propionate hydroxylase [Pseudomonas sp. NFACC44-2]SDA89800.1 3-(3-hydroxy-phenyl)propionate hydroxylase [Pseudomonas sp. NFACC51]SDW42883.1 3-(3-hydroxy-phenyl)propionate hydroxylase [Pseudomonas sp. NFACC08-1]SFI16351.1 3-(3-hydroxy-phenyl)propionate hydroxylase [Pseudomonas sp. NFACC54]SFT28391.1 3-(3-hydroxy-phenyl)propionate hydroxylase [P